jgi:FixJ family two-component response regulator
MANPPTVLVIEDDEQWQSVLKETLEDEGYNVIALTDYRQGRQALNNYVFDFVILDLELDESAPMLDGERLLRQLYQRRPGTPCVIVSGQGDVNVVRNAFKEYRVADFIPKDQFDIPNFVQTVQDALRQHRVDKIQSSVERTDARTDLARPSATLPWHSPALTCPGVQCQGRAGASGPPGQVRTGPLKTAIPASKPQVQLLQVLVERFNEGELGTLCFQLGIDYEVLRGEGKAEKARELIKYLLNRQRLPELAQIGQQVRPDILWEEMT